MKLWAICAYQLLRTGPATSVSYRPTVSLSYRLTVLLSYRLTVLLSHCPTVSLSYCLTVLLSYHLVDSLVQQPDRSSVDKTTDLAAMYFLSTATTRMRRSQIIIRACNNFSSGSRGSGIIEGPDNRGPDNRGSTVLQ